MSGILGAPRPLHRWRPWQREWLQPLGTSGKRRLLFAYDVAACGASLVLGRMLSQGTFHIGDSLHWFVLAACAGGAILLPLGGAYRTSLRHASLGEAMHLSSTAALLYMVLGLADALLTQIGPGPRVFLTAYLVLILLLAAPRVYYRRQDLRRRRPVPISPGQEPVLLIGNGTACELFLRSLRREENPAFHPIGILDDVSGSRGTLVHSIPVLGSFQDSDAVRDEFVASRLPLKRIILTEPLTRQATEALSGFLGWARFEGIPVSQLPSLTTLRPLVQDGRHGLTDLNVPELLERQEARVDYEVIRRLVGGRRVLVTGAGGSIGSELTRHIASLSPSEIVLVENCELNHYETDQDLSRNFPHVVRHSYICCIRDADRLREIFYQHRPELVFNAAALKHVPIVEANPCEGVLTNVIGARNVADIALETGAIAMIQISTDKAVNTSNVMGATKRVAEFYCQALDRRGGTRFMTVRFGNVLGSSGSLIPLFQRQIARGGPLTVTDPRMTRYFMTIREAVELTLLASAKALEGALAHGRIMVLDMGEPIKIVDIAHRMIRMAGLTPGRDIEIATVGIRPGEKLFEELFDVAETREDCGIEGVQAATPKGLPLSDLQAAIAILERAARRGQRHLVVATLADVVPGYNPLRGASEEPAKAWPARPAGSHGFRDPGMMEAV